MNTKMAFAVVLACFLSLSFAWAIPPPVPSDLALVLMANGPPPVIQISSIAELQKIGKEAGYPLNWNYVLAQDIDASQTSGWNDGRGFEPIGNNVNSFTGTFDGQGHAISGLFINRPASLLVGLFGLLGPGATVKNLGLVGGSVTGLQPVGMLAGANSGTVESCYATGTATGEADVGGLIGQNLGTVTACHATGAVTGDDAVGGLVGFNFEGTVSACYATGAATGDWGVGGLVGENYDGTVTQSFARGTVTGVGEFGGYYVGGLVGLNDVGTVSECYAAGPVTRASMLGAWSERTPKAR